jgi:TonB-dependent receptor
VAFSTAAMAQQAQQTDSADTNDANTEVIEVKGVRQTIQSSISIKRESTEIVDGISANDIGDLPALSIGEALETLTGASSHREQGGATEISIRGLGPFLGSNVINGREATNGSGDRSINFSQFPSELFSKAAIYKTQSAELIEGGVSGQIHLDTVKPLDFGKRRFQMDYKLEYNPDNEDLIDPVRDFGNRLTASYVDQFKTDRFGEIGIAIGAQRRLSNNPEQEARTGTAFSACNVDPGFLGGINIDDADCEQNGGELNLRVDPETGEAPDADTPFVYARSQYSYRQNITDDSRDSLFGAIQWRPSDRLEINADVQVADRTFSEIRNDLIFAEVDELDGFNVPLSERLPIPLTATSSGALRSFTVSQTMETLSNYVERDEQYLGGGINFAFDVSDTLRVSFDVSYSDTERTEDEIQTRLQIGDRDLFGNNLPGTSNEGTSAVETGAEIFQNGSLLPVWTFQNFDVNYSPAFFEAPRVRLDLEQFRNNNIVAARTDFDYIPEWEHISAIKGGLRFSRLRFDTVPGGGNSGGNNRFQATFSDASGAAANLACANPAFRDTAFLSGETGGRPLFTNVDENGNVIAAGTGNSFASFDPICLAETLLNTLMFTDENGNEVMRTIANSFPVTDDFDRQDISAVDVQEETFAGYLQADYDTFIGDYGVRGNFGVRVIHTDVSSASFRGPLTANRDPDSGAIISISSDPNELERVIGGGSYTEVLPSVNLVVDVSDDILVRSALYRALSRPDPSDLGFGRLFLSLDEDSDAGGDLNNIIANATAIGNPFLEPLMSWNGDVAVEWYPNDDTILALGLYYKRFNGGFDNSSQVEVFEVFDPASTEIVDVETVVTTPVTTDENSELYGLELTATHSFAYLDSWLNGFGFKLSYNYAQSNFEFEDDAFGTSTIIDDGELIERVGIALPADIFGFSEHVFAGQLYYQYEGFNAQINYKFRSEYFQQFVNTPGAVRFIGDTEVWEAKVSYRPNRNWRFSLEAINIFDEPRRQYRPSRDNFSEINVYGPRLFAGVQYRY